MFAMEIRKLHYYSYHSNSCKEEKILHQKHESFTLKLPLIKLRWLDQYKTTKNTGQEKGQKNFLCDYLP